MANNTGKQVLQIVDAAAAQTKIADHVSIQAIFAPAGTTETFSLIGDRGETLINFACSATVDKQITFSFPISSNNLSYLKSAGTQKIYIYLS